MQLIASRNYPFLDSESLEEHQACDSLFRTDDGTFLLYIASSHSPVIGDRLLWLSCRDALIWINNTPDDFGEEWEYGGTAQVHLSRCLNAPSTGQPRRGGIEDLGQAPSKPGCGAAESDERSTSSQGNGWDA